MWPLGWHLPTQLQTWITWGTDFKPINILMSTGGITKTVTLTTTFYKPVREANSYSWFGYVPLMICNHIRGQVSISMNDDIINMIRTSQQYTKEGFNRYLEGCFISIKAINWNEQVVTPNQHPFHNLLQTCGGSKPLCPVWIWPIDNFQSRPGTSFRINEHWYDQFKNKCQQSTMQIL